MSSMGIFFQFFSFEVSTSSSRDNTPFLFFVRVQWMFMSYLWWESFGRL